MSLATAQWGRRYTYDQLEEVRSLHSRSGRLLDAYMSDLAAKQVCACREHDSWQNNLRVINDQQIETNRNHDIIGKVLQSQSALHQLSEKWGLFNVALSEFMYGVHGLKSLLQLKFSSSSMKRVNGDNPRSGDITTQENVTLVEIPAEFQMHDYLWLAAPSSERWKSAMEGARSIISAEAELMMSCGQCLGSIVQDLPSNEARYQLGSPCNVCRSVAPSHRLLSKKSLNRSGLSISEIAAGF